MYTYEISFPEHAEKIVHPDHLLTTHCPVHLGELVILSDGSKRRGMQHSAQRRSQYPLCHRRDTGQDHRQPLRG